VTPRIYESQSCGSMGSDWSGPRGNLAHYSRLQSRHQLLIPHLHLANTLAVLKPGASGLPTLPKVSLTLCKTKADSAVIRLSEILCETIAEQVTGRARLPRDPML
jgi:hypothetical protein